MEVSTSHGGILSTTSRAVLLLLGGATLIAVCGIVPASADAARNDYRLELWVKPVGEDPIVRKLGKTSLTVYPQGVRIDSLWLDGFTRRDSENLTLLKPIARLYAVIELDDFSDVIRKLSGTSREIAPGTGPFSVEEPADGRINRHPARRHRISVGPTEWVDVWTSRTLPENRQLDRLAAEILEAVSNDLPQLLDEIDGTPILIRLHTKDYENVDILGFREIGKSSRGHAEDLTVGRFYIRARFAESLWD